MIFAIIAAVIGFHAGYRSNSVTSEEEAAAFDAHWADVAAFFPRRTSGVKPAQIRTIR